MKVVLNRPAVATVYGTRRIKEWREAIAQRVDGADHMPKVKRGQWDGYVRPGNLTHRGKNRKELEIRRGLLPRLIQAFPNATLERNHDAPPPVDWESAPEKWEISKLRDYQTESLRRIFKHRWGRVALATNAGKGAIMGIAGAMAEDAGMNVAVFADEISVFEALLEEIRSWGDVEPELVEAGRDHPPSSSFVVGMIPTLYNRVDREPWVRWLQSVDFVMLDEADRATSDRWVDVLDKMPNTHYRIGFSGSFDTHEGVDAMEQEELMGPILIQAKNRTMVERGISARPKVELYEYIQDFDHLPDAPIWFAMDGTERRRWAYENGVVHNENRHQLIRSLLPDDEPAAVVVERVEHGEVLADKVLEDAEFLYGEDDRETRRQALDAHRAGDFKTLVVTRITDRGTNLLGHTRVLVFASGEGSQTQILQRTGRGLRRDEDKEQVIIRDIVDREPPWETGGRIDPYGYFETASKKRADLYRDEGFDITYLDQEEWQQSA